MAVHEGYRRAFRDELNRLEAEYLSERAGAMGTYAWRRWYEWSALEVDRLIASMAEDDPDLAYGGLGTLHQRLERVTQALGPPPQPVSRVSSVEPASLGANDPELGQLSCDHKSREALARAICADLPYGGSVLFLGDDDLVSLPVQAAGLDVTVVDVDPRIGDSLRAVGQGPSFVLGDVRRPLEVGRFEAVVMDPADGSHALDSWFRRASEHLVLEEGARVYLSLNRYRLGRRWVAVVGELARHDLHPVAHHPALKLYPLSEGRLASTDLWIFERLRQPTLLPLPYVEIETMR